MNRRQLLLGIAAAAVVPPVLGPGGPIYNITPDPAAIAALRDIIEQSKEIASNELYNYTQIFRKTLEVSATSIQLRLENPNSFKEVPLEPQEWWEDELVER